MNVYVIRNGRNWDNPRIQMVVYSEEDAIKIVEHFAHKEYEQNRHFKMVDINSRKEAIEFRQQNPEVKLPLYLASSLDADIERQEHDIKYYEENYSTYEKWREYNKYPDWFYEAVPVVESGGIDRFLEERFPLEFYIYNTDE